MKTISVVMLAGLLLVCGKKGQGVIIATGTIEAIKVTVSSRAGGEVKGLSVDEGSRVAKGDTIARIDHSLLDLQLRQAKAGVELATANLRLLKKGARSEDRQQAEESLRQAAASNKVAEADARRMEELHEAGSVSAKQRDDAEARATVNKARYNAALQAVKKIKNMARPEELQAARARVKQAQGAHDLLQKRIDDCTIISPAAGVVTHKLVEPGELAGQGSPLVTIAKTDQVDLMIYVTEVELGRVTLNQNADISIDSYPAKVFPGTIVYISPEAEFTPKNIQTKDDRVKLVFGVKIAIDNPEGVLKAGMPADAVIKTN